MDNLTEVEIDVQDVFNKVINRKYYSREADTVMCYALSKARSGWIISEEEYCKAKEEIQNYIGNSITLSEYLRKRELPYLFEYRLKIYKNWANRPIRI